MLAATSDGRNPAPVVLATPESGTTAAAPVSQAPAEANEPSPLATHAAPLQAGDQVEPTEPALEALVVAETGTRAEPDPPAARAKAPAADHTARGRFEQRFPAHAAATQDPSDPATSRWAVLIGINEHAGTTRNNLGSRQDAEALAAHLRGLGWRDDHVLLLTEGMAPRENIIEAIRWLHRKVDASSVSIFHYTGHTKQWPGWDVDADGETTDEALWPSDNRHISDGEWAAMMAPIPGRIWINIGACEAAGYLDPGVAGPNRIVTFSSAEDEKSYEDPKAGHSVWGAELVVNGLRRGHGDHNGDGHVTVEEAANFAIPRALTRTKNQRYGPQRGGVVDQVDGDFRLDIPPSPAPSPTPTPSPSTEPQPSDEPCSGICLPGVGD